MYELMPSPTRLEARTRAKAAPRAGARPHVCFVAPTTWPMIARDGAIEVVGGAEVQQSMIAPALVSRGYRVSMICHDYGQPDGAEVDGITVHNMHKPDEGIPVVRFLHPRLTSLWGALARADADVYYQRSAAAWTGFVAAFCRRHGRASIYAGASDVDFLPGQQEIRFARDRRIFEWGLRRVDRVVVQNDAQREQLREHYGREGVLIPSCYRPRPEARADRAGYVLWVATMRPSKRGEKLLEIARLLPQHRFVMVGGPDPAHRPYFEALVEAARALPNVEPIGFAPYEETERYFNGARAFLNTSLYEGFPNTFLQSWSRGIPTVGFFDTGSRREGKPPYDLVKDVRQAARAIDRLMRDDVHWHQASQRSLAHFHDNHAMDAVIAMYEREISALAGPQ
jgi:glycosyltransferase involved in cell wall biosynthesis